MDGNGGPTEIEHMVNSDEHATKLAEEHPEYDVTKIYMDAYPQESTPEGSGIRTHSSPLTGKFRTVPSL